MYFYDSHCHIDKLDNYLSENINNLLLFFKKKKIKYLIGISVNLKNFFNILSMISCIDQNIIKLSCGIHPLYLHKMEKDDLFNLKKFLLNKKVVAIGECGLDYSNIKNINKNKQIKIFKYHLYLSQKYNKPCIIHSRFSSIDTINVIKNLKIKYNNIILHCYNYSNKDILFKFLNLGVFFSISGLITFKNNYKLQNIIKYIPLDRLLVETDSPYLTPYPYRGIKNDPSKIILIIKKISDLKKVSFINILRYTKKNFLSLFKF